MSDVRTAKRRENTPHGPPRTGRHVSVDESRTYITAMRCVARIALAAALCAPSAALAQGVNAPPGNAAIDQYTEQIPAAGGDKAAKSVGKGDAAAPTLTAAERSALRQEGVSGVQLADFTDATAPVAAVGGKKSPSRQRPTQSGGSGGAATARRFEEDSSSPIAEAVERTVAGSGGAERGMGAALPVILLVTAAAGIAYSLGRRRSPAT
jgi:hypothetical protein